MGGSDADGRVVLVACGASGVGAATARRLGSTGYRVVVGDADEAGAQRTVGDIAGGWGHGTCVRFRSCRRVFHT